MRPLARLLVPAAGVVLTQLAFAETTFAQSVIGAGTADLTIDGPPRRGDGVLWCHGSSDPRV